MQGTNNNNMDMIHARSKYIIEFQYFIVHYICSEFYENCTSKTAAIYI